MERINSVVWAIVVVAAFILTYAMSEVTTLSQGISVGFTGLLLLGSMYFWRRVNKSEEQ